MTIIRLITEKDVPFVADLYRAVYGDDFPFQEFYDTEWIKRGVFNDEIRWFVAEHESRLLGSATVMLNSGDLDDLVSEVGRLVVHPDSRGLGLGSKLVNAVDDSIEGISDFAFAECRTAHIGAQKITTREGYRIAGVEPLAYDVGGRESVVFVCKLLGNGRVLRKNNPRVIPEVHAMGSMALQAMEIENDLSVTDLAEPYPVARGEAFRVKPLDSNEVYRLLRLSRDSILNPEIFGSVRLEYGFLKVKAHRARYLLCRRDQAVVGGLGYVWDNLDAKARVFELVAIDELTKGTLLEKGLAYIEEKHDPAYVAVDVNAHAPRMQKTLDLLGFATVAYAPSMVYAFGDRFDVVRMVKLRVPPRLAQWKLIDEVKPYADLVTAAVTEKARGVEIDGVMKRVRLFEGLTDVQVAKIAAVCGESPYKQGERVFGKGETSQALYVVLDGSVAIVGENQADTIAHLSGGDLFGEMALIEKRPRSANAVAESDINLLVIRPQDFDQLVRRDPEVGSIIYRNLATTLSRRLRGSNPSS